MKSGCQKIFGDLKPSIQSPWQEIQEALAPFGAKIGAGGGNLAHMNAGQGPSKLQTKGGLHQRRNGIWLLTLYIVLDLFLLEGRGLENCLDTWTGSSSLAGCCEYR